MAIKNGMKEVKGERFKEAVGLESGEMFPGGSNPGDAYGVSVDLEREASVFNPQGTHNAIGAPWKYAGRTNYSGRK